MGVSRIFLTTQGFLCQKWASQAKQHLTQDKGLKAKLPWEYECLSRKLPEESLGQRWPAGGQPRIFWQVGAWETGFWHRGLGRWTVSISNLGSREREVKAEAKVQHPGVKQTEREGAVLGGKQDAWPEDAGFSGSVAQSSVPSRM